MEKRKEGWHYELAEKIVNNLPAWKKELYEQYVEDKAKREREKKRM